MAESFRGTGFPGDDLFPVPLVYVDRVEVIQLLVPADGVHVGVEAGIGAEAVALQGQALPLCQRMDDLDLFSDIGDIKGNGAFHAVEVIVDTAALADEQRGGDAGQVELQGEFALKGILDQLDGDFGLQDIQRRAVVRGELELR